MSEEAQRIANFYRNGGDVKASESRLLARAYLELMKEKEVREREVLSLSGGELVTDVLDYGDNRWALRPYRRRNGSMSASWSLSRVIERAIQAITSVKVRPRGHHKEVSGGKSHVNAFLELNGSVSKAIQDAYDAGFDDANNTLMRLASGEASIAEYGALVGKYDSKS